MSLQKAQISDGSSPVVFQFNPQTISFKTSAKWKENRTSSSEDGPVRQFEGTDPITLKLDLILDAVEAGSSSVAKLANRMASWTNPTPDSAGTNTPTPPELEFSWGDFAIGTSKTFACHMKSVSVTYTMFRPSGEPVRAKVSVELVSKSTVQFGQNPTSGGLRPHRIHLIQRGDQLATIAAREYGSATYWRAVAEYNHIDDPMSLPIGRRILLPALAELGEQ